MTHLFIKTVPAIVAILCAGMSGAHAESSQKPPAKTTAVETNSIPQSNLVPQSVYVVPSNPSQGRDPFFPNSTRLQAKAVVRTTPDAPRVTLGLNGLGGTPEQRLAIINGHTFAEGESADVTTPSGRVMIRCVEIKEKSAIVEVGNVRQELFLRSGN